jgi:ABC-type proline/glycine betaine transport system permease subunit
MGVEAETMQVKPRGDRHRDRAAAAFLLLAMLAGCLVLWIGIPLAVLWAVSNLTESGSRHFLLSLMLIPTAMILFAPALLWLNDLYLRVEGVVGSAEENRQWRRSLRGPLRPLLYISMVVALVALFFWIFFLAENPPYTIW